MTPLTPQFIESCPVEKGFHQRGLEMTRIEVFVDAAFAFAVTLLVISFVVLCAVFVLMYRYAASLKNELLLDEKELHETRTVQILWAGSAVIGVLLIVTAATFPDSIVPFSGMSLALLGAWFPLVRRRRSSMGTSK